VRRALLSVADKTGLASLARGLAQQGMELVSTGGTAAFLSGLGLRVRTVSEVTGFPEILDGRVKTLHPRIHAGLLARRDRPEHVGQLQQHGIEPFHVVAVNLYPFRQAASVPEASLETVLEEIDIGGPALLRAAAKNYRDVLVVCDPADYPEVLAAGADPPAALRYRLALKAFRHTAFYDAAIAEWLERQESRQSAPFPAELTLAFQLHSTLRYGENPHQRAAVYGDVFPAPGSLVRARQLGGKELSYNNLNDAGCAWELAREFPEPAVAAVKHATPCGVAIGRGLEEAFRKAQAADPVSIFGGVVALNRTVSAAAARALAGIFLEVVVAPGYEAEAAEILAERRDLRVLQVDPGVPRPRLDFRPVPGGVLLQEADLTAVDPDRWRQVTARPATSAELADLALAWRVVRSVRSNAIVLAREGATTGIGGGQTSRIGAARIAIAMAEVGGRPGGSVMASDAFFPFPDVVEAAAACGVTAIVQPGGSLRDADSIAAADRHGLAMLFTGVRHFRH